MLPIYCGNKDVLLSVTEVIKRVAITVKVIMDALPW